MMGKRCGQDDLGLFQILLYRFLRLRDAMAQWFALNNHLQYLNGQRLPWALHKQSDGPGAEGVDLALFCATPPPFSECQDQLRARFLIKSTGPAPGPFALFAAAVIAEGVQFIADPGMSFSGGCRNGTAHVPDTSILTESRFSATYLFPPIPTADYSVTIYR